MATYNDFSRSFTVNAAMSAGRRVALSNNGSIGLAAAEQFGVGVLERDCTADAFENPKVRLPGTGSVSGAGRCQWHVGTPASIRACCARSSAAVR